VWGVCGSVWKCVEGGIARSVVEFGCEGLVERRGES
jgi:hypothetical protein